MRLRRPKLNMTVVWITVVAVVLAALGALLWGVFRNSSRAEDAQQQANSVAGPVSQLCSRRDQVARALTARGACKRAAAVQRAPVIPDLPSTTRPGSRGPRGPQGQDPSQTQVRQAVTRYLQANPPPGGRPPSTAEVTAAVASVYARNPPADGRPPTAEEIADAVAGYCSDETCRGPQGARGPGPTPEQIAAAVAAYCDDGACRGPKGDTGERGATGQDGQGGADGAPGPRGVSITRQRFERNPDGACVSVVDYSDGHTTTQPAGDAACPPANPQPSPTPTPGG